jgi:hypothetical protein
VTGKVVGVETSFPLMRSGTVDKGAIATRMAFLEDGVAV